MNSPAEQTLSFKRLLSKSNKAPLELQTIQLINPVFYLLVPNSWESPAEALRQGFGVGGDHEEAVLLGQRGRGLSGRLETHRFNRPSALGHLANVPPFGVGIKGKESGLPEWICRRCP